MTSDSVVQQLLDEMNSIVCNYDHEVRRTGTSIPELVRGTAFLPGGAGLWRGSEPFGGLPDHLPEKPVMFVAHNFDSIRAYDAAKLKGGEAKSFF
jgi:hypothetical protein